MTTNFNVNGNTRSHATLADDRPSFNNVYIVNYRCNDMRFHGLESALSDTTSRRPQPNGGEAERFLDIPSPVSGPADRGFDGPSPGSNSNTANSGSSVLDRIRAILGSLFAWAFRRSQKVAGKPIQKQREMVTPEVEGVGDN
ncbi:hypothetical protein AAF712_016213, partial [Marasmius tenuissimus]